MYKKNLPNKKNLAKDFEKEFKNEIRLVKSFLFDIALNRHNIAAGFSDYFNAYVCALEEDNILKVLFSISFIYKDLDNDEKIINPWEYQFLPKQIKEKYKLAIKIKTKNIFHDRLFSDFNTALNFAKKNM